MERVTVSTPGRVCLFGEHQDYLHLPVIPCAISLHLTIEGRQRSDNIIHVALPDIKSEVSFSLDETLPYVIERDYFRSAVNVLRRSGFTFPHGFECCVQSEIPISAGTSSSAALVVSWVNFLAHMSDQRRNLSMQEIARYAYEAEVLEFSEPGGMMDQYSTAYGGVLFLKFIPTLSVEQLHPRFSAFVLGDSGEQKDTKLVLSRLKNRVLRIASNLSHSNPGFDLQTVMLKDLNAFKEKLTPEESNMLYGTIRNRDITQEALDLFHRRKFDERKFGDLLTEHQNILRDILGVSTPKIDGMVEAALNAGAYGGKINGSGGGGCMFAYAPENPEAVFRAIESVGGKAYIVHCDSGTRIENKETHVG